MVRAALVIVWTGREIDRATMERRNSPPAETRIPKRIRIMVRDTAPSEMTDEGTITMTDQGLAGSPTMTGVVTPMYSPILKVSWLEESRTDSSSVAFTPRCGAISVRDFPTRSASPVTPAMEPSLLTMIRVPFPS